MKIIHPLDDFVSKYLVANNEIANDILSIISSEEIVSAEDPRVARVVKHLGRAIIRNPDLLHAMVMEDFMEAEAERERIERDRDRVAKDAALQAKDAALRAKDEAIQAQKEAIQAKEAADEIAAFWKAQFEALQQKIQG